MFTNTDIIAKAWLVTEVINLALMNEGREVDKIFLIGSYASGKQTMRSDLDFLVQLKGGNRPGMYYVNMEQLQEIKKKVGVRVHVVFGTEEAAKRLHEKHKNEFKDYSYKEITQGRIQYANPHRPSTSQPRVS